MNESISPLVNPEIETFNPVPAVSQTIDETVELRLVKDDNLLVPEKELSSDALSDDQPEEQPLRQSKRTIIPPDHLNLTHTCEISFTWQTRLD